MSDYYELLRIQSTASPVEIEAAIEQQYNQWRRLVTNHDSGRVRQAEGALALLEQMRRILLDPAARAGYDAAIGIAAQQTGGLTDPEALLRLPAAVPPSIPASPASSVTMPRASTQPADAWICPQCQTTNPLKTRFCSKCGQQLGIDCPNCGKLTKAAAEFCSECGRNLAEAAVEANKQAVVSQWLKQMAATAKTMKYIPTFRAVVAEGSFHEVFPICVNAMAAFSTKPSLLSFRMPLGIKDIEEITADTDAGQISGMIYDRLTLPITRYSLELNVQKTPQSIRGVALVVIQNLRGYDIFGSGLSFIADPFVQYLLNRSERFKLAQR